MAFNDNVEEVKSLLEDNVTPELKRPFYYGDPIAVPVSSLPTVAIEIIRGESVQGATGYDEQIERIIVKVLVDKRSDMGKGGGEVTATKQLVNFVEEMDDTGTYKDNTILGVLRQNLQLEGKVYNSNISWEYGVVDRQEVMTAEAWITIETKKNIKINRS